MRARQSFGWIGAIGATVFLASACGAGPPSPPDQALDASPQGFEDAQILPTPEAFPIFPDFFIPSDRGLSDARFAEALPDRFLPDLGLPDSATPDAPPCTTVPSVIGRYDGPTHPTGNAVAVVGTVAYVAGNALLVLDVSTPASPALLGSYPFPSVPAEGIAIAGSLAYVAGATNGLYILDVTNPAAITLRSQTALPVGASFTAAEDVVLSGSTAYVAGISEVVAFDVSNPAAPKVTANLAASGAYGVSLGGTSTLLVAESGTGLVTAALPALTEEGGPVMPASANGAASLGSTAFVADATGLATVDISSPRAPLYLAQAPLTTTALGVTAAGRHAYVADGSAGLAVVDVKSPSCPIVQATVALGAGQALGVALDSTGHAFVADSVPALVVVDLGCTAP